jgi:tetratricopeptide (TPR) repeat protein
MGVMMVDVIGKNPYDQGFYPMLEHMQRGGVTRTTMPTSYQGEGLQNMFGNQPIIMETELVDFGAAGLNGTEMLKDMITDEGLAAARKAYGELDRKQNPEGYGFHEWEMNALGYDLMGEGQHQAAHFILEVNQERNPKSWNACDSLADAYMAMGNVAAAKDWYEKALALNPEFGAARNKLEQLKP